MGSQIGRFLRGKIISYFRQKLAFLTLLKVSTTYVYAHAVCATSYFRAGN